MSDAGRSRVLAASRENIPSGTTTQVIYDNDTIVPRRKDRRVSAEEQMKLIIGGLTEEEKRGSPRRTTPVVAEDPEDTPFFLLRNALDYSRTRVRELEAENNNLKRSSASASATDSPASVRRSAGTPDPAALETDNKILRQQVQQLQLDMRRAAMQQRAINEMGLAAAVEEAAKKEHEELIATKKERDELLRLVRDLNNNFGRVEQKRAQDMSRVVSLEAMVSERDAALASTQRGAEEEVLRLRSELALSQAQAKKLEDEAAVYMFQMADEQDAIRRVVAQRDAATAQLQALQQQTHHLAATHSMAVRDGVALEDDYDDARAEIKKLKKKINSLETENSQLRNNLANANQQVRESAAAESDEEEEEESHEEAAASSEEEEEESAESVSSDESPKKSPKKSHSHKRR